MPTFAAIDIGSNSVRLKIARLAGHRLREIVEDREVTRLGESVFRSGFLSPEAMENTIKVLRRFHRTVQREGADVVRVVATSALREARNWQNFRAHRTRAAKGGDCYIRNCRRARGGLSRLIQDQRPTRQHGIESANAPHRKDAGAIAD